MLATKASNANIVPMKAIKLRRETFAALSKHKFKPARSLPLPALDQELRPAIEIARRLAALDVLFRWVHFTEEEDPSSRLRQYLQKDKLRNSLTRDERKIVSLPRVKAYADHGDTIGWKLENMAALAWVLGHRARPECNDKFMSYPALRSFLLGKQSLAAWDKTLKVRPIGDVIRMECMFYYAHNAVRSAQLGEETVPKNFDPVLHGGLIHERRHALTWCLSPGVEWTETDLST
jgi:hypothetical protein